MVRIKYLFITASSLFIFIVMVTDGGDAKSLIAIGKMGLKEVYVNEYTALYMRLTYKAVIKLK